LSILGKTTFSATAIDGKTLVHVESKTSEIHVPPGSVTLELGGEVCYRSAMNVEVQLEPVPPPADLLAGRTVVVFDILRATSVIVHAFAEGATEILPVIAVEEAFELAKTFPPGSTLLGGERGSRRIEGFDLGNSPREYVAPRVKGKRVILTTTNGTRAFHSVSYGKRVMVGSFFNMGALARECRRLEDDLLLYPSGDKGGFSLEDAVCAGMLIDRIKDNRERSVRLTDAARAAWILYRRFEANLEEALSLSNHGRELIELGLKEDLAYCARADRFDLVPFFRQGVIRNE
jgi:2-phosphosulfolactate phosphatase